MLNKINITKMSLVFLAMALFIQPTKSYAWGEWHHHDHYDHHYEYHQYPHFGLQASFLPHGFLTVGWGASRYYYCDGVYYRRSGFDYVVVAPPAGVIVNTIPAYYQPVVINGVTYYASDEVYYVYTPHGYQVVPPPVTVLATPLTTPNITQVITPQTTSAPIQVTAAGAMTNGGESFSVNIPNSKGGYTAVLLKRSGDGFVGPQGEFYSDFPKVEQLKAMYAK